MRLYDNIVLNEEVEELSERGIHKGYDGVIVKNEGDVYTVCFYNSLNFGESVYAKVHKKHLVFVMRDNDRIIQETEEHFANEKMDFNKSFSNCGVKEYDKVELLADKTKYAIEGVRKGANGCEPFPYAIEGK